MSPRNRRQSFSSVAESSQDTARVTNPNSSCPLQKSMDKPHLPPPSLGKTVLVVWAVGLGAWGCHTGRSLVPSFGLSG